MPQTLAPPVHPHSAHKQLILDHFNRIAPELDRWHSINHYYYQDLARLHRFLVPAGARVLAIGCGPGDLLAATEPSVGVGVDISPVTVNIAQRNYPGLRFYCADVETLTPEKIGYAADGPVEGFIDEPQTFDYIICANSASYFSDVQTVFNRLKPFCTAQTRLIITFHNYLWEPILKLGEAIGQRCPQPQQNWLSMDDVANLLAITGYIPLKRGRRFLIPRQVLGLSYLLNRYVAPLPIVKHLCLTNFMVARPDFRGVPEAELRAGGKGKNSQAVRW